MIRLGRLGRLGRPGERTSHGVDDPADAPARRHARERGGAALYVGNTDPLYRRAAPVRPAPHLAPGMTPAAAGAVADITDPAT